jgi:hypothetical protein
MRLQRSRRDAVIGTSRNNIQLAGNRRCNGIGLLEFESR